MFTTVLGSRPGRQLPLCRLGGVLGRAPTELLRLDRLAYRRIVFGVRAVAPHGVIAVRPARQRPAIRREPPRVNSLRARPLLRLGLDPALGEQLGVQRVTDGAVDLLHVTLPDIGDHVVGGVVPPVLHHRRLDRVLDPGQPLIQRLSHLAARRADQAALLVVGHRVPAGLPRLALGPVAAAVHLPALAGQRVGLDVEPVSTSSCRACRRALSCGFVLRLDELAQLGRHDVHAAAKPLGGKIARAGEAVGSRPADAEQLGRLAGRESGAGDRRTGHRGGIAAVGSHAALPVAERSASAALRRA